MSAYISDPRTIDYLVQWASNTRDLSVYLPAGFPATDYDRARSDRVGLAARLNLRELTPNEIGQILLDENVRSASARYPNESIDSLPGPCDKSRVLAYRFQPVAHQLAAWVVKACDCVRYQSCETDDYEDTLAYKVLDAIREAAIRHLVVDAPWGATQEDIDKHMAELKAKMFKLGTLELA
jgi:hypothetical protein